MKIIGSIFFSFTNVRSPIRSSWPRAFQINGFPTNTILLPWMSARMSQSWRMSSDGKLLCCFLTTSLDFHRRKSLVQLWLSENCGMLALCCTVVLPHGIQVTALPAFKFIAPPLMPPLSKKERAHDKPMLLKKILLWIHCRKGFLMAKKSWF